MDSYHPLINFFGKPSEIWPRLINTSFAPQMPVNTEFITTVFVAPVIEEAVKTATSVYLGDKYHVIFAATEAVVKVLTGSPAGLFAFLFHTSLSVLPIQIRIPLHMTWNWLCCDKEHSLQSMCLPKAVTIGVLLATYLFRRRALKFYKTCTAVCAYYNTPIYPVAAKGVIKTYSIAHSHKGRQVTTHAPSGAEPPCVYYNCPFNHYIALRCRMNVHSPNEHPDLRGLVKWFDMLGSYIGELGSTPTIKEFLQGKKTSMVIRVTRALEKHALSGDDKYDDPYEILTKFEIRMGEGRKPRNVVSCPPYAVAKFGPQVAALDHACLALPGYAKNCTLAQWAALIHEILLQGLPIYEGDQKTFEGFQRSHHWWLLHVFRVAAGFDMNDSLAIHQYEATWRARNRERSVYYYSQGVGRPSGSFMTSNGNNILAYGVLTFLLAGQPQEPNFQMLQNLTGTFVVNGDDFVAATNVRLDQHLFRKYGFEVELKETKQPMFCKCLMTPWGLWRDLYEFLMRFPYSIKLPIHSAMQERLSYSRQKVLAYAPLIYNMPILWVYYKRLLYETRNVPCFKFAFAVDSGSYFVNNFIVNEGFMPPMEPTQEQRDYFDRYYNIEPATQLAYENLIMELGWMEIDLEQVLTTLIGQVKTPLNVEIGYHDLYNHHCPILTLQH
jgi:hypothetical protein